MDGTTALVGRRFWLVWVLASIVSGTLGLAIMAETPPFEVGVLRGGATDTSGYGVGWAVILGGVLCGATLGGVQWLLLRRHIVDQRGWNLASAVGFALGIAIIWVLGGGGYAETYGHHAVPHSVDGAGMLGGALLGAVFGGAQWLVLRRRITQAGWWVPANAVGFAAGWGLASVVPVHDVPAHFAGGAVVGMALGSLPGDCSCGCCRALVFRCGSRSPEHLTRGCQDSGHASRASRAAPAAMMV